MCTRSLREHIISKKCGLVVYTATSIYQKCGLVDYEATFSLLRLKATKRLQPSILPQRDGPEHEHFRAHRYRELASTQRDRQ